MKSIIFSTSEVQAILENRKTQFRQVIEPQPDMVEIDKKNRIPVAFYNGEGWIKSKYQPGDILYVRETWQDMSPNKGEYVYLADGDKGLFEKNWGVITEKQIKWRSPVTMPQEATRIFLEVTDVKAERLQEITEKDVRAEGVKIHVPVPGDGEPMPKLQYKYLWDNFHAKKGFPYNSNPWVWKVDFRRVDKWNMKR